jgi:hypothetical protein
VDADGAFGGFAQLHAERAPADLPMQSPVELKRFYVDKPWQGRGLARDLMAAVEHQARARGARELWLGVFQRNARARAFYSKCGFRKVGTQVFVVGDDPQTDDIMPRSSPRRASPRVVGPRPRGGGGSAARWFGACMGGRREPAGVSLRAFWPDGGARLEVMTRRRVKAR